MWSLPPDRCQCGPAALTCSMASASIRIAVTCGGTAGLLAPALCTACRSFSFPRVHSGGYSVPPRAVSECGHQCRGICLAVSRLPQALSLWRWHSGREGGAGLRTKRARGQVACVRVGMASRRA